ncbi:MAG: Hint domain-containing protein [Roseicyclus sp.]|uniref:Hint domain-containing protein n=1 Tax=Roseicyclus sp. TaxID=1914329 RepID=UPI003A886B75
MAQITITANDTPVTTFTSGGATDRQIDISGTFEDEVTVAEQPGSQNSELTQGETVDVAFDFGGTTFTVAYQYIGFLSFNGVDYPVFFLESAGWLVVGIALDPAEYPTVDTVLPRLNTTDPFTDFATVCFAAGTAIMTPDGPRPVEALRIGDLVSRADGGVTPVVWIGRQRLRPWLGGPGKARLVRIAAGALGAGLPLRDLWVTPDHAIRIEGLLVNAGVLVNGATITLEPVKAEMTVHHVETQRHDVILAEGVAAESFVDYVGRQAFDNHAEYVALYGDARPIAESAAPRVTSARMLPMDLRARLGIERAA